MDIPDSKFDVIGFGALNVDKMFHVDSIAGFDGESFIKDSVIECGGSAANTIIGLSRLGLKTSYIGKIAEDDDGELLEFNLVSEGVFLEDLIYDEIGKTGNVLGFIDTEGNRELYVNPGVNDKIAIGEINKNNLKNTKIIHYSGFVGDSFNTQIELLNYLSDDIILSFDPGALYTKKGFDAIKPILLRTNILLINEIELDTLFNSLINGNINNSASNNSNVKEDNDNNSDSNDNLFNDFTFRDKALYLLNLGIGTIIIKRGEKGAYGINTKEEVKIPAFKSNLVDTTGAGDSFNAGFLYSYINNYSLEKSCIIGNYLASKAIESTGITNLPNIKEVKNFEYEIDKGNISDLFIV